MSRLPMRADAGGAMITAPTTFSDVIRDRLQEVYAEAEHCRELIVAPRAEAAYWRAVWRGLRRVAR